MLFNSYEFIFAFLPITFCGFFTIAKLNEKSAALWLALASLVFYGWSSPKYVVLLLGSISINYLVSYSIARAIQRPGSGSARLILIFGVATNLAALAYYKYAGFFVENWNALFHSDLAFALLLPLGISFFTFTQIAFLVDVFRGKVTRYDPIHYVLFVTYFPHLVAGPILHHKEMIPQFERSDTYRLKAPLIATGLTIFAIGLFKKTCLADGIQPYVSLAFGPTTPSFDQAWLGALAYTCQLYFDFSGYSDMAIGLSLLFGVYLPTNFQSPYKARNIAEFWRRWHMTLSRFLRDYLYVPLGGNRNGKVRRYINLLITMLLGGLWHGAAWTFVIWGALHGAYLCIYHAWAEIVKVRRTNTFTALASVALTFAAVVIAWVFFRADSMEKAIGILAAMSDPSMVSFGWREKISATFVAIQLALIWLTPNTQEIVAYNPDEHQIGSDRQAVLRWELTPTWAYAVGIIFALAVIGIQQHSEFIYFRF